MADLLQLPTSSCPSAPRHLCRPVRRAFVILLSTARHANCVSPLALTACCVRRRSWKRLCNPKCSTTAATAVPSVTDARRYVLPAQFVPLRPPKRLQSTSVALYGLRIIVCPLPKVLAVATVRDIVPSVRLQWCRQIPTTKSRFVSRLSTPNAALVVVRVRISARLALSALFMLKETSAIVLNFRACYCYE